MLMRTIESNDHVMGRATRRRRFRRLIEQQFWLWGCGIRCPDGNKLRACGFARTRSPEGQPAGTSRYMVILNSGQTLTLWGFGLTLSDPARGVLYLPRLRSTPRYGPTGTDIDDRWTPADFAGFDLPRGDDRIRMRDLTADAFRWIAGYERRTLEVEGLAYRTRCVRAWKDPIEPVRDLPWMWQSLAAESGRGDRASSLQPIALEASR
ncbi:MAG TPA: hypothetical protein VFQ54_10355 [Thermomicrobiales bacterium]|nr:hypothetical protein [Thermomicrobiales bacterium]